MSRNAFLQEVGLDRLRIVKTQPYPDRWRDFCAHYNLTWTFTPFERERADQITNAPGVYCFHIGHDLTCLPTFGLSLYGGITIRSLRTRFLEYFRERDSEQGRQWVRQFLFVFDGELSFGWSPVDTAAIDLKTLERNFNDAMMPHYSVKDFSAAVRAGRNAWP